MKFALHVMSFEQWAGEPDQMGARLGELARAAEDAGYSYLSVMDHFFQMERAGRAEMRMLEAYTTLGYVAASTKRIHLGALVGGVAYRHPGILIKQVTTLDVLSGGRAWFGIGAGWYEREALGLGAPWPPLKERFERLEETLQIAHQMWKDPVGPYDGQYYHLQETLNQPPAVQRPHPPILIGGSGERKTLRLVAQYADACNINAPDLATLDHKLQILQEHCERQGRNYDEIERTSSLNNPDAEAGAIVQQCGELAEHGIQAVFTRVAPNGDPFAMIERLGRDVIPQATKL